MYFCCFLKTFIAGRHKRSLIYASVIVNLWFVTNLIFGNQFMKIQYIITLCVAFAFCSSLSFAHHQPADAVKCADDTEQDATPDKEKGKKHQFKDKVKGKVPERKEAREKAKAAREHKGERKAAEAKD